MNHNLYDQRPEILQKICAIRDYLVENELTSLNYGRNNCCFYAVRLNTTPSPDGAMGMFLLLRRNLVIHQPVNLLENDLVYKGKCKEIEDTVDKNKEKFFDLFPQDRRRLQEKFEFYTYNRLINKGYKVKHVQENINDYDLVIDDNLAIEIKSDRWITTGNISLELLRNYKIDDCDTNLENIGSILKSRAHLWQEYFYVRDRNDYSRCFKYVTEIYKLDILREITANVITCIYNKIQS